MTSLHRLVIVTTCLCVLPAVATAQGRDRDGQKKPPQAEGGGQADRKERPARPRSPEADKPREQPKAPKSREPQLKRRKP